MKKEEETTTGSLPHKTVITKNKGVKGGSGSNKQPMTAGEMKAFQQKGYKSGLSK